MTSFSHHRMAVLPTVLDVPRLEDMEAQFLGLIVKEDE